MIELSERNPIPASISSLNHDGGTPPPIEASPPKKIQKGVYQNRRSLLPPLRSAILAVPFVVGLSELALSAQPVENPLQTSEVSTKPSYDPACEKEFLKRVKEFKETQGKIITPDDLKAYHAFAHMFLYGKPLGYPDNVRIEFNPSLGAFEVYINKIDSLSGFKDSKKEVVKWFLTYNLKTKGGPDLFLKEDGLKKIPFEFILPISQSNKLPPGTLLNSLPDDSCPTLPRKNNDTK